MAQIDKYAEGKTDRSAFVEPAVRTYVEVLKGNRTDQQNLRTINRISEKPDKEAEDVLRYQRQRRI